MSQQVIRLATGQMALVDATTPTTYEVTIPQAEGASIKTSIERSKIDTSKSLWEEKIPYRTLNADDGVITEGDDCRNVLKLDP